ncbi:unnamed protein product [Haemonchus placei]|uniref:Transposase n=1 Tax=Haemonchus placei TaxID=6290 RepID=A0A0N4W7J6_HAEPC|nr:unnamed protein product [Haemonchus placei]
MCKKLIINTDKVVSRLIVMTEVAAHLQARIVSGKQRAYTPKRIRLAFPFCLWFPLTKYFLWVVLQLHSVSIPCFH